MLQGPAIYVVFRYLFSVFRDHVSRFLLLCFALLCFPFLFLLGGGLLLLLLVLVLFCCCPIYSVRSTFLFSPLLSFWKKFSVLLTLGTSISCGS